MRGVSQPRLGLLRDATGASRAESAEPRRRSPQHLDVAETFHDLRPRVRRFHHFGVIPKLPAADTGPAMLRPLAAPFSQPDGGTMHRDVSENGEARRVVLSTSTVAVDSTPKAVTGQVETGIDMAHPSQG